MARKFKCEPDNEKLRTKLYKDTSTNTEDIKPTVLSTNAIGSTNTVGNVTIKKEKPDSLEDAMEENNEETLERIVRNVETDHAYYDKSYVKSLTIEQVKSVSSIDVKTEFLDLPIDTSHEVEYYIQEIARLKTQVERLEMERDNSTRLMKMFSPVIKLTNLLSDKVVLKPKLQRPWIKRRGAPLPRSPFTD